MAASALTDAVRNRLSEGSNDAAATPCDIAALLLDMDGVLAEVSQSYRAAIVQTAAHFGATVTSQDVAAEKAKGSANNDWVLTHRLIHANKTDASSPSLDDVTAKFEELYQGVQGSATPGLKSLETLIPPRGLLAELHRRLRGKMAIVTGRPRRDCNEFLQIHGLDKLLPDAHCVCMEDGPAKPDASPVLLAAKALGVDATRCVLVGDTPDDIRAAVAAGGVGLGVATPHDAAKMLLGTGGGEMTAAMLACGAATVLEPGLARLLDLFPTPSTDVAAVPPPPPATSGPRRRVGKVSRVTKETSIEVVLDLDGTGKSDVDSGIGFLDHMLCALAKHGRLDLTLKCKGDLEIDDHHSSEDCALALGEALDAALAAGGGRVGIRRYGSALCPLDEALARAVIDISSRPHAEVHMDLRREMVGAISTEMLTHVLQSFATAARITMHVDVLRGQNDHHKAEASFKAVAVALRTALSADANAGVPSTKGVLA